MEHREKYHLPKSHGQANFHAFQHTDFGKQCRIRNVHFSRKRSLVVQQRNSVIP